MGMVKVIIATRTHLLEHTSYLFLQFWGIFLFGILNTESRTFILGHVYWSMHIWATSEHRNLVVVYYCSCLQ